VTLSAVGSLEDAFAATRAFLWPVDRGRWARLVVVTLFVGGVGGVNPLQFQFGTGGGSTPDPSSVPGAPAPPDALPPVGGAELAVVAGVVVLVASVTLGVLFVGSVMEFVLVDSLRREAVTVRRYWRDHWRRGIRLFGFRLVLGVVTLGVVGVLLAVVLGPVVLGWTALFSVGLLVLAVPAFVLVAAVVGLVDGFTTVFVVPVMLAEERPVLSAWRRLWPTLTANWKEYAVYTLVSVVLGFVGGLLVGVATALGAVAVAVPFGLVALLGVGLLAVVEVAGFVVIGLAAVLFGLSVVALALTASMPVTTFYRYYALFVLGDTNGAFDLVAERRRAVRE
jgi:hypothetical protein